MTPNFSEKLKEAVRLKQGKDYQTAWHIFSNLAGETNPDSAYFWFNYAHLAFLMKRYDQAKSLVETALSIDPRDRFSRSLYAGLLLRSGDGESALTIVDELMEKQPEIPLLRKVVAESERRNILRELQPFMEKWLVRYEQDPELLSIAAEFFHKIGQDEKAIQYYQQVVDREPENQFAYERLLALKTAGKGIEERIKQLTLILKMPSREKNVHLLGLLAREYKKAGDWDRAERTYRKILSVDPNNLFERKQLGFLYAKKGDHHAAADILQDCLTADPDDHFVRSSLISCWKKMKAKNEALAFIDQLLNRYPEKRNYYGIRNKIKNWPSGDS